MEKKLGKIESLSFGSGGYDDAMFGFSFTFCGDGWGVSDFWGTWSNWSEGCKWTVEDQSKIFTESLLRVKQLLTDAKKSNFVDLKGVPVEVTLEDGRLSSWRILTEVI